MNSATAGRSGQPSPPAREQSPVEPLTSHEIDQLVALFGARRFAAMEEAAYVLLARHPRSGVAWKALGAALLEQGKDALHAFQQAVALSPHDAETLNNLGNALLVHGRAAEAVMAYRQALTFKPNFAEAECGLGAAHFDLGQLDDAAIHCQLAIDHRPAYAMAYNNLGNVLRNRRQHDEALQSYYRALAIEPNFAMAHDNLLMLLQFIPEIKQEDIFAAHRRFGEQFESPLKPLWPSYANTRVSDRRLKIGYVSGDFRTHAVTFFIGSVFANHDKSQVEVFAYSNSAKHDAFTDSLVAHVDHWCPCLGLTDEQLAERIRTDGIDILVDLSGHTAQNRLQVFARKPAPIQITYLGYPGSSGLTAMDYRLTDHFTEPREAGVDRYYTEKLLRMPDSMWCYRPDASLPDISPLPALSNGYLTFGSFNNVNKIGRECIALWATLLCELPTSRLLMATVPEGKIRQSLMTQFAEHGVTANRIDFCGKLEPHEFHRKLQEVDLSLDPFPVNGATTTCESLWLGIPVLTLVGDRFLSRAGLSVLSAAHLSTFAATTRDAYIHTATMLANDLTLLSTMRANMREHLKASPLFDQQRFTRNLETIYRDVWHQYIHA